MNRIRARLTPYLLILPGGLWLTIFFAIPMLYMLSVSLMTGNVIDGFRLTFHFPTYAQALGLYHDQLIRSLVYGLIATALCIAIAYPMAYWIAFRGGSRKSTYLFLILLPFFVSFVLRTISWQFFLSDNGIVLGPLKSIHLLPENFSVLATAPAVIGGLTYNFLPFMVLPIYVALERVDHSLVEASYDLYAGRIQAFLRVVLPLSLPGVFAGVLITFVPASSDYVNASVLGGPENTMIGNVIQNQYFVASNYPVAAALSFILMAVLLLGIFAYARALGTEDVLEAAAG
ncbi:MAG TPA: ABC transporter permease [Streptosporangiaceae bacterium]|jgi:spermidine/putrescine transport system permease protein